MSDQEPEAIASNAKRLLWAGFVAILAAGVGFAVRNGILDNWAADFGFSNTEVGIIAGQGFTGFCFGIFIGGLVVDKIGYGKLVIVAFLCHFASAAITFLPAAVTADMDQATAEATTAAAYNLLFWGTFLFAFANGTLEAVANPLVATLFPNNRTHYLNILHASWPLGMIFGGVIGWVMDDKYKIDWRIQLALFLIPTIVYGIMFLGQKFPRSEASESGLSFGQMAKDVGILGGAVAAILLGLFFANSVFGPMLNPAAGTEGAPIGTYLGYGVGAAFLVVIMLVTKFSVGSLVLFVLFIAHALVGAVELGTDGWIANITGNILSSEEGKALFVYTSLIMFGLRFCAHFIEKKLGLSPIGLLLVCSVLGCVGLQLASGINSFGYALLALGIYAAGKTFFWPTMLAVIGDRFPQTGAVAMSIMGGIGMMSAGLIGSAGLGFAKDKFSGEALEQVDAALFDDYQATEETDQGPQPKVSRFLVFDAVGLDTGKVAKASEAVSNAKLPAEKQDPKIPAPTDEQKTVVEASITGDRMTLKADSFIPATMAAIYLLLLIYFKARGGYKAITIADDEKSSDVVAAEHSGEA